MEHDRDTDWLRRMRYDLKRETNTRGVNIMSANYQAKIGKTINLDKEFKDFLSKFESETMLSIEIEVDADFHVMVHKTYELFQSSPTYIVTYKDQICTGAPPYEHVYKIQSDVFLVFYQNTSKTQYRWRCKLVKENMTSDEAVKILHKMADDYVKYLNNKRRSMIMDGKNVLEDVILPSKLKKSILDDLDNFLVSREKYKKMNMAWKRGYIFSGPPGNGKTLLLKKIGSSYGLTLKNILDYIDNSGQLKLPHHYNDNSYYEDDITGLNIHKIVTGEHEDSPPEIFYLEDMDKVIGRNDEDFSKITLSDFLTAIDGVKRLADGIILIGTTNNKDRLETAILGRPGRFERIYEIDRPGKIQILDFFKHKKFVIENKSTSENYANILFNKKFSMAFVEEFVLSCITDLENHTISKKVAESVLDTLETYNKLELKETSVGF